MMLAIINRVMKYTTSKVKASKLIQTVRAMLATKENAALEATKDLSIEGILAC